MRAWDLTIKLLFEPLSGLVMLALGAVAIAAGSEDVMDLAAALTFIDGHPVNLGTTLDNGLESFMMTGGHILFKAFDIFGAVSAEDFGNVLHFTAPS